MEIKNKVAHLKGLMEGMEFDVSTKEGKIINAIDVIPNAPTTSEP